MSVLTPGTWPLPREESPPAATVRDSRSRRRCSLVAAVVARSSSRPAEVFKNDRHSAAARSCQIPTTDGRVILRRRSVSVVRMRRHGLRSSFFSTFRVCATPLCGLLGLGRGCCRCIYLRHAIAAAALAVQHGLGYACTRGRPAWTEAKQN